MPKRPDAYFRPQTLEETLRLLARPNTMPLGGGTSLLAGDVPGGVVDLQDLGLNTIRLAETQPQSRRLAVGATTKLAGLSDYLAQAGRPGDPATLLCKAIHQAGPNTFRHAATLGGLTASRPADSELLAALLVLDAELTIYQDAAGPSSIALSDYLAPAGRPAGLITGISLAWEMGQGNSERVARTPADYPIVSVTLWQPDGAGPRLAATGVAARPVRLAAAEAALAGGVNEEAVRRASQAGRASSHHPGDFRGDPAYRAEMAAVLIARLLRPQMPA